jgi:hypothetical protein
MDFRSLSGYLERAFSAYWQNLGGCVRRGSWVERGNGRSLTPVRPDGALDYCLKPQDSMMLIFEKHQKRLLGKVIGSFADFQPTCRKRQLRGTANL